MSEEQQELYVRRRGRIEGPWSLDKIRSEIKLRKLGRHDELSFDGLEWLPASKFVDLFPKVAVRKPAPVPESNEPQVGSEASAKEEQWYCYLGDEKKGPMDRAELESLIRGGELVLDDLIWRDGFPDWLELENVPEFASILDSPASDSGDSAEPTRIVTSSDYHRKSTSRLAIWGLILSILPPPCCGVTSIGLILCIAALISIKKNKKELEGGGYAVFGIVCSLAWMLVTVVGVIIAIIVGAANS